MTDCNKDCGIDPIQWGRMLKSVEATEKNTKEIKDALEEQNGRLRKVEIRQGYMWGGLGVIGVIVPLIFKYVI